MFSALAGTIQLTSKCHENSLTVSNHTFGGAGSFNAKAEVPDPTYEWTRAFGGKKGEVGNSVCLDEQGNLLAAGSFRDIVDFDFGVGEDFQEAYDDGFADIFVTKQTSDGAYSWTKTFGSADSDFANAVATSADGAVIVVGQFTGTVDFDPGIADASTTSFGLWDAFVVKLDAFGNYQWSKSFGWTQSEVALAVATDTNGMIYVGGYFTETVDFDPTEGVDSHSSVGYRDWFITKLGPNGEYHWTRTSGSENDDQINGIAMTSDGSPVIVGGFAGEMDCDPTAGVVLHDSMGSSDVFVIMLNKDGSYEWSQTLGASSFDVAHAVAVDSHDNINLTGHFRFTVDFDPGPKQRLITSSFATIDAFILQFEREGDFVWAHGMGSTGDDRGMGIATNGDHIFVCGTFENQVDFDPTPIGVDKHSSEGGKDAFLTEFNNDGGYCWTRSFGGDHDDTDWANSVASDGDFVIAVGSFLNSVDFDAHGQGDILVENGGGDVFVTAYTIPSNVIPDISYFYAIEPSDESDRLYRLDLNGTLTPIGGQGGLGWPQVEEIVYDTIEQKLYGYDKLFDVWLEINVHTGLATELGDFDISPPDLTFNHLDGMIYGIQDASLYRITPETGEWEVAADGVGGSSLSVSFAENAYGDNDGFFIITPTGLEFIRYPSFSNLDIGGNANNGVNSLIWKSDDSKLWSYIGGDNFDDLVFEVNPITGDQILIYEWDFGTGLPTELYDLAYVPATSVPEPSCTLMDTDGDGDIDLIDYAAWQNCLTGPF